MARQPTWLDEGSAPDAFPDVAHALRNPNGLLAVGGDLSTERLVAAYHRGIFPWFSYGQPILWWSPQPRTVLYPKDVKIRRSLRKVLRQQRFDLHLNRAFPRVIRACAAPRQDHDDTWITDTMVRAYERLHERGYAHSVEAWQNDELVGGLYGVALGRMFFGESMFSKVADASKAALVHLCSFDFAVIDCQLPSTHLHSMGAIDIDRSQFQSLLHRWCGSVGESGHHRAAATGDLAGDGPGLPLDFLVAAGLAAPQ